MIVVDTNIIAYHWIPVAESALADRLLESDSEWIAPYLWRSEFRSVLSLYLHRKQMSLDSAAELMRGAEEQMDGHEYFVQSNAVFKLVVRSTCSAYDCEFVALALDLGVPLVTTDRQVLKDFPTIARSLTAVAG